MEPIIIDTPSVAWEKSNQFPESIEVKVLRNEEPWGARTLLVKIPPGGKIPAHSHRGVVQQYVLEGHCYRDGADLCAGTFMGMSERHDVAATISVNGASLLLIYDPVAA